MYSWNTSPGPGRPPAPEQGSVASVAGSMHVYATSDPGSSDRLKTFWIVNWTVLPVTGAQLICPYLKWVAYAGSPPPRTAHNAIIPVVPLKTFAASDALRRIPFILRSLHIE